MTSLIMNNGYPTSSRARTIRNLENNTLVRNLPELNLPEKILFVIDTVMEENCTPFYVDGDIASTTLKVVKKGVESFISTKSMIQNSHEYALVILDSKSSKWVCSFSNNSKSVINHLNMIFEEPLKVEQKTYDLGQLFERIEAGLPKSHSDAGVPMFVIRVIFIYTRSNCVPKFEGSQKSLENLMEDPYFFLDSLYIHESVQDQPMCKEIYFRIAELDRTNLSYIFEVERNIKKLDKSIAKLVGHPLQRPPHAETSYSKN